MIKGICQICKDRPATNYDGRWICVYCWPEHANEVDDPDREWRQKADNGKTT